MDTVVLQIANSDYQIIDPKKFTPFFMPVDPYNTTERVRFFQEHRGHKKYIQNPPASFRDEGIVYPNLRIDERMRGSMYSSDLMISFSCPKLIWGQSFDEVNDNNFSEVVSTLSKKLLDMGVRVREDVIRNAIVNTLHYCANILFPSEEEARMFLKRLSKTSLNGWFENNTKDYRNNGNAVRFHTSVFEIVFYLKYYDVLAKGKSSLGRKITLQEKVKAKELQEKGEIPPVVRLEIRSNGTRSVREHLKSSLGEERQYWTFQDVFNCARSRKMLKYYWDKISTDPINNLCLVTVVDEDICEKVLNEYSDETIKNVSEALGLFYLLKSVGVKRMKSMITDRHSRQEWYRKKEKIIDFAQKFIKRDDSLIKIVTQVLEDKPIQVGLPIQVSLDL